jgi:predicted nucleotidyltransferase
MEKKDLLNRIKLSIESLDPYAEVYLFGSRARGDFRKGSDWDILVVSPKNKITFEFERELHDHIYDIELESGEVISLLVYSKADWLRKSVISPLFSNVRNEGIRI